MTVKCRITERVLQGEIMNPISYALFIFETENSLIRKGLMGVKLHKTKAAILLAFANDVVFLSEAIVNQKKLLKYLKEYFDFKGLEINIQ